VRPEKHRKAGGNMIRKGMQALEKAGLLVKKKVGRYITPKGQQLLDSCAKEISQGGAKQ
jgi:ribosomal protein S19E (S16A)